MRNLEPNWGVAWVSTPPPVPGSPLWHSSAHPAQIVAAKLTQRPRPTSSCRGFYSSWVSWCDLGHQISPFPKSEVTLGWSLNVCNSWLMCASPWPAGHRKHLTQKNQCTDRTKVVRLHCNELKYPTKSNLNGCPQSIYSRGRVRRRAIKRHGQCHAVLERYKMAGGFTWEFSNLREILRNKNEQYHKDTEK